MTCEGDTGGTSLGLTPPRAEVMMPPVVLIIESRKEVAAALEAAIEASNFTPITVPYLESLADIPHPIAAIVVRVAFEGVGEPAHAAIAKLPRNHPPVVAIAWEENELAEARRLKCEVVLHAPHDITRLRETLTKLVGT